MPFLSMVRMAAAETRSFTQRFSLATQKRRSCRLGRKRRRVLLLACETLLPVCTPLPVTWHTRDITHLDRSVVGPRSPGTLGPAGQPDGRSEEHTSELQSLMRISYAAFCLKKKTTTKSPTKAN